MTKLVHVSNNQINNIEIHYLAIALSIGASEQWMKNDDGFIEVPYKNSFQVCIGTRWRIQPSARSSRATWTWRKTSPGMCPMQCLNYPNIMQLNIEHVMWNILSLWIKVKHLLNKHKITCGGGLATCTGWWTVITQFNNKNPTGSMKTSTPRRSCYDFIDPRRDDWLR